MLPKHAAGVTFCRAITVDYKRNNHEKGAVEAKWLEGPDTFTPRNIAYRIRKKAEAVDADVFVPMCRNLAGSEENWQLSITLEKGQCMWDTSLKDASMQWF